MPNTAPALAGFEPSIDYFEDDVNAAPRLLDGDVTFTDPDGNFNGGALTVSGLLVEDRVAIRNEGSGAGQIGVSGSTITFGGVAIGSFAGGIGDTLTVTFNGAATSAAIEALIENLTYANVSDTPTASRTLILNVTDADGADLGQAPVAPVFAELMGAENPFNGFDVGSDSRPTSVDVDGDGDVDLVVGNEAGRVHLFRNDGGAFSDTLANPFHGIDVSSRAVPAFVDLEGDGDMDAIFGTATGELRTYENDGGTFTRLIDTNPFSGLDVGNASAPAFADVDGDGDMDLVVGNQLGLLRTFENIGDDADADSFDDFVEVTGAANPFAAIDFGSAVRPTFGDVDGDGDMDAAVGTSRTLETFRNDDGVFTQLTSEANPLASFNNPGDGIVSLAATFIDLDADGDADAVVGSSSGLLFATENITPHGEAIGVNVISLPPVAQDDAFATNEATLVAGDLFADNGSGADQAFDADGLTVATVNGSAANVGSQIVLSSGALLTVNSDGTFEYDPNDAFDPTPAPGSGASNRPAVDGFTYTLPGGGGATVTIIVEGLDGNDLLFGTAGTADALSGGVGNDSYVIDDADDLVIENAGEGDDRIFAAFSYALGAGEEVEELRTNSTSGVAAIDLAGNELGNRLIGNDGTNALFGNGGNDRLYGEGGDDDLFGGDGNDVLNGGAGADFLDGGSEADLLRGGAGDDAYRVDEGDVVEESAGQGTDTVFTRTSLTLADGLAVEVLRANSVSSTVGLTLIGNGFAQTIIGAAGKDVLNGRGGGDTFRGNAGDDAYVVNGDDEVVELAGGGTDTVFARENFTLAAGAEVEMLRPNSAGSTAGLRLTGNGFAQTIIGTAGSDLLDGRGGGDVLRGGRGGDAYLVDGGEQIEEAAGAGADTLFARASFALAAGVEVETLRTNAAFGTEKIDLSGNEIANRIIGNAGDNALVGKGGADTLRGLGGSDRLYGGNAGDALFGEDGNDLLVGGAGNDLLDGGAGQDGFRFDSPLDAATNIDQIAGFIVAEDTIQLDDAVFTGLAPGALPAGAFRTGSAAADAGDRIVYDSATGALYFDADGSGAGAQVQFARLDPGLALTASDFSVI